MKNLFILFIALCGGITVAQAQQKTEVPLSTVAQKNRTKEHKITGSFEMNYLRHYLWRGAVFGNNDVAQPELEVKYKNLSVILSQNLNYRPQNVPKEFYTRNAFFDEQDVEVKYTREWEKFSTETSLLAYFYFFQPQSPNTAEISNWSGYNFFKDFSVFTENSLDIAIYRGAWYSSNGIVFDHDIKEDLNIEWSAYAALANARFNSNYYGTNATGLVLIGSHAELKKTLRKYFIKLTGEINSYRKTAIKTATELKGTNNFGIAVGVEF